MKYEATPIKNSKDLGKTLVIKDLEKLKTGAIMWHLVKRHKFGLVSIWAVTITVLYLFPFAPHLLISLI